MERGAEDPGDEVFLFPLRLFADALFEGFGFVVGLLVGIHGGEFLADGKKERQRAVSECTSIWVHSHLCSFERQRV
jgi:hypothetical protein